ncbi:MAG: 50S ribosomal protein L30e [Methanosarcinales archaeon]|nr:50S ribosomal protein L30e [Methanosarcinales archaeon]
MDVDLNKVLRSAIQTGNVIVGSKRTQKAVESNQAKAVVLASNCPEDVRNMVTGKVPIIDFPGIGVELGTTLSKPYAIAAMAVIDPGESDIMSVLKA